MLRSRPTRFSALIAVIVLSCAHAPAQNSGLPPNAPTSAASSQIAPLIGTAAQPDAATRAHRADVVYASGLISINASNSSLNQILREIAKQTGMKITGGVRDERVFGHYGPATPSAILATLIAGTGTNMMLRQTDANAPEELILTPRGGGATPPNPNAPGFDDGNNDDDERPAARPVQPAPPSYQGQTQANPIQPGTLAPNPGSVPPSIPQPVNNPLGNPQNTSPTASTLPTATSVSTDAIPTPSTVTQTNPGIVDAPNPPAPGTVNPVPANPATTTTTGTTDPATPATPKTAEQYFQELQKLRQQQQQQSTTPK